MIHQLNHSVLYNERKSEEVRSDNHSLVSDSGDENSVHTETSQSSDSDSSSSSKSRSDCFFTTRHRDSSCPNQPSDSSRTRRRSFISRSSRFTRRTKSNSSKCILESIPEESRQVRRVEQPSLLVSTILLLLCLFSIVGYPSDVIWQRLRKPRTLLTLSPKFVDQYPFTNFLDVDEMLPTTGQKKIVGMYWQIPRCGGTTLKHILGTCLRRVAASRTSADYCDMNSLQIQTCQTKVGTFVNADPSDHGGIQRCKRMELIQSEIPDVIVSSRILHAATLYDEDHKGRIFTIMRNPIERAVSTFYYLQNAYWERHYRPELKEMTLLDYAALPDTSNNWMTRWLTGKNAEPTLTRDDLEFAKELLRRKFLILLTDQMAASIERLLYYMNWVIDESHFEETRTCLLGNTKKDRGQNRNKHVMPEKDSPEYQALLAINELDLELYEYATDLFKDQQDIIMTRRNQRTSELFIEGGLDSNLDHLGHISQLSEHEAASAAAALMARPPDAASMQSVEATNNLVATALMIKLPNRTSIKRKKDESDMISNLISRMQGSARKWSAYRGVPVEAKSFEKDYSGSQDNGEGNPVDESATEETTLLGNDTFLRDSTKENGEMQSENATAEKLSLPESR